MSKTTERDTTLSNWTASVLQANPDALAELPTDPFRLTDLEIEAAREFTKRLVTTAALNSWTITDDGVEVALYGLTPAAKSRRDEILSNRWTPLPCDHAGLHNLTGDTFECCWEACDDTFSREAIADE